MNGLRITSGAELVVPEEYENIRCFREELGAGS